VESDVDQNSVVIVLLTPVVNALTPVDECETAIVTGFFYAIDIDPDFSGDRRANQAEVFYTFTADPQATVTCAISKDQFRRGVPPTFSHEFQHMISYNQHVLVRNAGSEALWLNEGLSHLAEELAGLAFRDAGQQQTFSEFLIGNLYNAFQYLKAPGRTFLAFSSGGGTLQERGSSWLFLRWLVDRFGTDIIRRMSETRFRGEANITNVIGEPMTRLTSQWFLANYVSDLADFSPPERLTYDTWSFRSTFQSLNQQLPSRFDRPFPIVPTVSDGASLSASGTLHAGSGDYFRVVQSAAQQGFTLRMTDPSGQAVNGSVQPRLNVIRIR
jgi:hypothetical protein